MSEPARLIFDLDGTLTDPAEGIWRCINYALASFDLQVIPRPDVVQFIGPPLDESFRVLAPGLDESGIRAIVARYRERYAAAGYRENVIYPGISQALEALSANRVPMGVCTSKREDFANQILEMFEIRHHFQFVSGGDIGIRKTSQLQQLVSRGRVRDQAMMIGDRAIDINAARENHLIGIGVLWGYGSREELLQAGTQRLLSSTAELVELAVSTTQVLPA